MDCIACKKKGVKELKFISLHIVVLCLIIRYETNTQI